MAPIFRLSFRLTDAERDEREAADYSRSVALSGLAVTLALLVASLFLVQHLHKVSKFEDCLLTGRSDCDILLQRLH